MSSKFRDYLLERYTPSVLVLATDEAEKICQEKNGLSVVDLLRPFGFFHHLSGEHATTALPNINDACSVLQRSPTFQPDSHNMMCFAVPVRVVQEQPYRIKEFRLRFYGAHTMVQPSIEVCMSNTAEPCPSYFY
jgi:hypothetical protein